MTYLKTLTPIIDEISIKLNNKPIHILCLSEHHLDMKQIERTVIPNYILNAHFCRNIFKKGGVCIFTHKTLHCREIKLNKFSKEKDLEVCATELQQLSYKVCIMTIYRSPTGDFQYFLNTLEEILNSLYNKYNDIILCGDININYNINSTIKKSLETMLSSFGLSDIITFPTRIQNESHTKIDNIFINTKKLNNYLVYPSVNGLSDHDAQCLIIHNLLNYKPKENFHYSRKITELYKAEFNIKLSHETWNNVSEGKDVNTCFNNFLNTYTKLYDSCFPLKKVYYKSQNTAWITSGIRISSLNKRKLFIIQ